MKRSAKFLPMDRFFEFPGEHSVGPCVRYALIGKWLLHAVSGQTEENGLAVPAYARKVPAMSISPVAIRHSFRRANVRHGLSGDAPVLPFRT